MEQGLQGTFPRAVFISALESAAGRDGVAVVAVPDGLQCVV